MSDSPIEEKRPINWAKSVVVTLGILVVLALVVVVALALLGPAIGNVYSGSLVSL